MIQQTVIALHGWGSTGTGSNTINRVRKHFEEIGVEVITPTYDCMKPDATAKMLLKLVKEYPYAFIVGMSYGGFWARWLANQNPAHTLFIMNPALDAYTSTEKYLGNNTNYVTGVTAMYIRRHRKKLKKYHIDKDYVNLPITAIVATDDDVVCPTTVENEIGEARCDIKYVTGGHRLEDPSQYLDYMEQAYHTLTI